MRVRLHNDAAIRTPARYVPYRLRVESPRASPRAVRLARVPPVAQNILECSPPYRAAFGNMVQIHDRYSLEGRDPNTHANILGWVGLHGRPRPERPVSGTIRRTSSDGMKCTKRVDAYISDVEQLERMA